MIAIRSFFSYELRRHLPTLTVGAGLLLAVPAVHRLVEGCWRYWDGEWNVAGAAVAVFAIAPLLALGMAISGWASERATGELEWLYARPLSAARIFWLRLAVVAAAMVAWIAVALLVNGVSFAELFAWSASWNFPAGLGLLLIVFFLAGGYWASALFQNLGTAFQGFFATALVLGVLGPFLVLLLSPTTMALLIGGSQLLLLAGQIGGGGMVLALLIGAWVAMRRSPADPGRRARALWATGSLAVIAVAAVIPLVLLPLQVDSTRVQGVRWLGDGTILELRPARGIATPIAHPILRYRDGSERPLRRSFTEAEEVFAHPGRGVAIMPQLSSGIPRTRFAMDWVIVDRQGEVRLFELPVREWPQPIGWSPRGKSWAWKTQSYRGQARASSGLMILNEDLRLDWRQVRTPSTEWSAAWIDERRLLLTPTLDLSRYRDQAWWWMVISADGRDQVGPHPLPEGTFLFPVALGFASKWPPGETFRPFPLAVRGSELVVLLSNGYNKARLANLDLDREELDLGPAIVWPGLPTDPKRTRGFLSSFGSLADGSLLWAESASLEQTRILRMSPPASGEPTEICSVAGRTFHLGGRFRGTAGSWALWDDIHETRLIACHLDTGEIRVLDDLGPLGTHSADVVDDGVVTVRGKIFLD